MAAREIAVDNEGTSNSNDDFEAKLRKLNRLREDGLITEAEFEKKRDEIMSIQW